MFYKGVFISRNQYGYFVAWLDNAGYYCQAETLSGCKKMIAADQKREITNKYK